MSDVAYSYYESTGMLQEIEKLIPSYYINWQSIGNDMSIEGSFYSCNNGYVEVIR